MSEKGSSYVVHKLRLCSYKSLRWAFLNVSQKLVVFLSFVLCVLIINYKPTLAAEVIVLSVSVGSLLGHSYLLLRPQSRAIDKSDCGIAGGQFAIDPSFRVVYGK